jgi:hypothetical protein
VRVDIKHPYIGDLRVALTAPSGRTTVLHPRLGGSADDLVATYDSASPGVLGDMIGQPFKGNWILNLSDRARRDVGKLRRWSLELRGWARSQIGWRKHKRQPKLLATRRQARDPAAGRRYSVPGLAGDPSMGPAGCPVRPSAFPSLPWSIFRRSGNRFAAENAITII